MSGIPNGDQLSAQKLTGCLVVESMSVMRPSASRAISISLPTGSCSSGSTAGSISTTVLKSATCMLLGVFTYASSSMADRNRHPLSAGFA